MFPPFGDCFWSSIGFPFPESALPKSSAAPIVLLLIPTLTQAGASRTKLRR